jgi:cytochrome d ubiquinol oxidase subunit I
MTVVLLSRIQFALTVIFHFWFVATTVGVMLCIVIFELLYAFGKGNREKYGRLALFFMKIYFFSFAIGVVTGLVMELQFGMNWSAYSSFFGDIIGVPLAIEGITAFFLESTLLGLWRFTWGKINKKLHVLFGVDRKSVV